MSPAVDPKPNGNVPAMSEEAFLFAEPAATGEPQSSESFTRKWRVLIADDDDEVHQTTRFALRSVVVDGRAFEFLHAKSAFEAISILKSESDIAVAMLDVVMETPDAGLRLVEVIRNELELCNLRIILRTGQPGYAPELDVIRDYDINDYRTKAELSQTRLITSLTSALRAYEQLEQTRLTNLGMRLVARASNEIFKLRSTQAFAKVLTQSLSELFGNVEHAMVCFEQSASASLRDHDLYIESGWGCYQSLQGCAISKVLDAELQRAIRRSIAARTCVFDVARIVMWLGSGSRDAIALIDLSHPSSESERRLIEMLAASLSVGFENVDLLEKLDFYAFFDPLTHLPNRTRFISIVDQDLFARQGVSRCLAILDIVRFSEVNDALGHPCGDSLLIAVAKRLRNSFGASMHLARISADSFGVYGPENAIDPGALNVAFNAPFFIHGHALTIQLRIGLVRVNQCKGNAVELMRNANLALLKARDSGGAAYCEFSVMMSEDVHSRVHLLHNLRAAIDFKRGLSIQYQPLLHAVTREVLGIEALLRWRNDAGEIIPPRRFIPLAERTGMIHELGLWVLEQSLHCLSNLQRRAYPRLSLFVNISVVQLRAEDFIEKVARLIELSDVSPACLVFDLTEAVSLEDQVALAGVLNALKGLGVRLALDDFGAGKASLRQLLDLNTELVKIDPRFIENVCRSERDRELSASILNLARNKGQKLIAEGVESAEQAQALLTMGCELMQGYYFARPMNAKQLETWLGEQPVIM